MLHLPLRRPARRIVSGALAAAAVLLAFPVPSQAGLAIEDGVTADVGSGVPGGVSAVVPTGVRAAARSGVRAGVQASAQASARASVTSGVQTGARASIESMIRQRWAGTGHASFAVRVAHCESKLNPGARHRNRNGTVDYGVFQLNSGGTLQSLGLTARSALDPGANINAAYRLWRMRGWRPWTCA